MSLSGRIVTLPASATCLVVLALALTSAPVAADFDPPEPVTPAETHAEPGDAATDEDGDTAYAWVADGSFHLRVRRQRGGLTPVRTVAPVEHPWSVLDVAVDRDGDGIVVWDQGPLDEATTYLYARRFDSSGELGPVRQVAPAAHWVTGAEVGVRPGGQAVVTWAVARDGGYVPYVRTLGVAGGLGTVRKVGPGPDVDPPLVAVERSGRVTLVWTNPGLFARRVAPDGTLGERRKVRAPAFGGEQLLPDDLDVDRRGVITVGCTRWTRNTAMWPEDDSYHRACVLRISPRLRLMERVRDVSQKGMTVDGGRVVVGSAPRGGAVVGWQRNYVEGSWLRSVHPGGRLGERVKVSDGGTGVVVLAGDGDGYAVSRGVRAQDGLHRLLRVTRIRGLGIGRTRTIARNDYDTTYLWGSLMPGGRLLVSWAQELDTAQVMATVGR